MRGMWHGQRKFRLTNLLREMDISSEEFQACWASKVARLKKTERGKKQLVRLLEKGGFNPEKSVSKETRLRNKIWFIKQVVGRKVRAPISARESSSTASKVCIHVPRNKPVLSAGANDGLEQLEAVDNTSNDSPSDLHSQPPSKHNNISVRECLSVIGRLPATTFEAWREQVIGKKLKVPGKCWSNCRDKKTLFPWLVRRRGVVSCSGVDLSRVCLPCDSVIVDCKKNAAGRDVCEVCADDGSDGDRLETYTVGQSSMSTDVVALGLFDVFLMTDEVGSCPILLERLLADPSTSSFAESQAVQTGNRCVIPGLMVWAEFKKIIDRNSEAAPWLQQTYCFLLHVCV